MGKQGIRALLLLIVLGVLAYLVSGPRTSLADDDASASLIGSWRGARRSPGTTAVRHNLISFLPGGSVVGLGNIHVIHANDTQVPAGGRADRHWHIGEGLLGEDTFAYLLNHPDLRHLPFILETPGDEHLEGRRNLDALRALV